MKKALFLIIGFYSFTLFSSVVFAAPPECPEIPLIIDIDAKKAAISATAIAHTNACLAARDARQEALITDFHCPSGDYDVDNRPYTREILAYEISVAAAFAAVDENALMYARALHCIRDTDPLKWRETNKIVTDKNTGYASKYLSVCNMEFVMSIIDPEIGAGVKKFLETSDTFPQYCENIAQRKINALFNLSTLIASGGVGKAFQNDKDLYMSEMKGRYRTLLNKTSIYMRLVGIAVAKLDKYSSNTIKK